MKDVYRQNSWHTVAVQIRFEPPPILLIKQKLDFKMERYDVKIKFRLDHMSEKLDMYEFKVGLFENCKQEELFLFIQNFNIILKSSVMIAANAKLQ